MLAPHRHLQRRHGRNVEGTVQQAHAVGETWVGGGTGDGLVCRSKTNNDRRRGLECRYGQLVSSSLGSALL